MNIEASDICKTTKNAFRKCMYVYLIWVKVYIFVCFLFIYRHFTNYKLAMVGQLISDCGRSLDDRGSIPIRGRILVSVTVSDSCNSTRAHLPLSQWILEFFSLIWPLGSSTRSTEVMNASKCATAMLKRYYCDVTSYCLHEVTNADRCNQFGYTRFETMIRKPWF